MIIAAIDPGPSESAFVTLDCVTGGLVQFGKVENYELLDWIQGQGIEPHGPSLLAIEMIASYGMAVGAEVFRTCVWIGRFVQAWGLATREVYRREVKLHLCGQARAKDANVRAALVDRFGPGKAKAVGTKAKPGPLYGVKADCWAALGVAVTIADGLPRDAISSLVANDNELVPLRSGVFRKSKPTHS
jgi:hypothetical protein